MSSVQTDLVTILRIFKRGIPMPLGQLGFSCKRARGWSPDLQQDGHKAMMQIGMLKPEAVDGHIEQLAASQQTGETSCHRSFALVADPLAHCFHPESLGFFRVNMLPSHPHIILSRVVGF